MKYPVYLLLFFAFACGQPERPSFSVSDLKITWTVVENLEGAYANTWKITNTGSGTFPAEGWALYYNHVVGVPVAGTVAGSLNVTQVSGTFYSITPSEAFKALGQGESTRIDLQCGGYGLKITDAPTGLYLIMDNQEPQEIENFEIGPFPPAELMKRGAVDQVPVPTTELRYRQNEYLSYISQTDDPVIIPTPQQVEPTPGNFGIPEELVIGFQPGLEDEARMLKEKLSTTGLSITTSDDPKQGHIRLTIGSFSQNKREHYRLHIKGDFVLIEGSDPAGVFYGTQSLISLWPLQSWESNGSRASIRNQTVTDGPRFPYRGLYLDVARNFQKPETIKRALDMMAFYKLNKLTFGVSNDEGWRLEIKGIPGAYGNRS